MESQDVIVVGAGPAGLTAAYMLGRRGRRAVVLESGDRVGGIARTETYKGYRFDIGGHRFYTKVDEVQRLWEAMLGDDFKRVPRLSRIHYRGRFFKYPLSFANALASLGPLESLRILASYGWARLRPSRDEETFEQWVTNRFGRRLYLTFFKTYTEKVWGIPCSEIRAEWAAQRIRGLSLTAAVRNALLGGGDVKSLIDEFHYPVEGPGMMWERFAGAAEAAGSSVLLNTRVVGLRRAGSRVEAAVVRRADGEFAVAGSDFISTMPVGELVRALDPPPPERVLEAASRLKYRAFLIAVLIVDRAGLFPDNWIYVHTEDVRVGRIQCFNNWSRALVPDEGVTSLGMEYFCSEGDDVWSMDDAEVVAMAERELGALGLARGARVVDGVVIRQPKAYPVYDGEYRAHLDVIREYLATLENLQTIGRNGMHRYNNQDHSMLTGMLAVENLFGARHDLWDVNTERSYYEEFTTDRRRAARARTVGAG